MSYAVVVICFQVEVDMPAMAGYMCGCRSKTIPYTNAKELCQGTDTGCPVIYGLSLATDWEGITYSVLSHIWPPMDLKE